MIKYLYQVKCLTTCPIWKVVFLKGKMNKKIESFSQRLFVLKKQKELENERRKIEQLQQAEQTKKEKEKKERQEKNFQEELLKYVTPIWIKAAETYSLREPVIGFDLFGGLGIAWGPFESSDEYGRCTDYEGLIFLNGLEVKKRFSLDDPKLKQKIENWIIEGLSSLNVL